MGLAALMKHITYTHNLLSETRVINVPFFTLVSGQWKRKIQQSYCMLAVTLGRKKMWFFFKRSRRISHKMGRF